MALKVQILTHVAFEGPASTLALFYAWGAEVETLLVSQSVEQLSLAVNDDSHQQTDILSAPQKTYHNNNDIDLIMVMGGPMGADDHDDYPWLLTEKHYLKYHIENGTKIVGICLGAQILARLLGADVVSNNQPEIGWFPITFSEEFLATQLAKQWLHQQQKCIDSFHWHGDRFDIPDGAIALGSSEACAEQGFLWQNQVLGLQFHMEMAVSHAAQVAACCAADIDGSDYTQSAEEFLLAPRRFEKANIQFAELMQAFVGHLRPHFSLHPQLQQDTHFLLEVSHVQVLLHKNATIPWLILVPMVYSSSESLPELHQLPSLLQSSVMHISQQCSEWLLQQENIHKINVASLGNMVPQCHWHVVGRHHRDSCWPGPVWGCDYAESTWSIEQIERIRAELLIRINTLGLV